MIQKRISISITEVDNGYVVTATGGSRGDLRLVYSSKADLEMIEKVGEILLDKKINVERR